MDELATTLLDVLALLLMAAGATAALWPYADGAALAGGGVVVAGGSWLSNRRS